MNGAELPEAIPVISKMATFEARRLIGLGWFRPDEEDDLEQDLLLHWWRKRRVIPTDVGIESAYGAVVIRNKARDLVRRDYTPVRDRRKNDTLPEEPSDDDRWSTLPRALITEPRCDNAIDVRRVIEQLPPAKQQFAWLLADRGLVAAPRQQASRAQRLRAGRSRSASGSASTVWAGSDRREDPEVKRDGSGRLGPRSRNGICRDPALRRPGYQGPS